QKQQHERRNGDDEVLLRDVRVDERHREGDGKPREQGAIHRVPRPKRARRGDTSAAQTSGASATKPRCVAVATTRARKNLSARNSAYRATPPSRTPMRRLAVTIAATTATVGTAYDHRSR